jgi:hypothetical protein
VAPVALWHQGINIISHCELKFIATEKVTKDIISYPTLEALITPDFVQWL